MKEIENDKMLKSIIKDIKLDKPGPNFTLNVMNKVHDLAALKMHNMKLRILDKNFWIIVFLFGTLAAIIVILSLTGNQPESGVNSLLPSLDTGKMGAGYQLFIQELNSTPISVAAILLATSTLIFIERFLSKKKILS